LKADLGTFKTRTKAFAVYTLNSFKQIADVNVDKVTLEFDINVSGEAGIPYITKGSIGSNFKNYRGVFV